MERPEQDGGVHRDRILRDDLSRLALWGPMGAGKTTVGQLLGRRHGIPVLDLDDLLDARVPFDEPSFRSAERDAFRLHIGFKGIIALGGGALLDPQSESLAWMFRKVVVLLPPDDVAVARAVGKPLAHAAGHLVRERARAYRRSAFRVVTFNASSSPEDVADAVESVLLKD